MDNLKNLKNEDLTNKIIIFYMGITWINLFLKLK